MIALACWPVGAYGRFRVLSMQRSSCDGAGCPYMRLGNLLMWWGPLGAMLGVDPHPGRSKGPAMARCGLVVGVSLVLVMAGCGGSQVSSRARVSSSVTPSTSSSTAAPPASTTRMISPASTQTTPAVVIPTGGPVPAGFAPSSFTAIGAQTWWLLGNAPCASAPCTSIVRTTNGGVSFVGIPAPRAPYDPPGSGQTTGVWQLRFADPVDGFAYDTSLYVTHNGGSSWHPVSLGGSVTDLATGAGEVYAVVGSGSGPPSRLMRSPVGREDWVALAAAGTVSGGLWVHGTDVFVESLDHVRLLVSHDRANSFTSYPVPAGSEGLGCRYQEMTPPVVWAFCATGTEGGVQRSTNGGRSFQPANGNPESHMMLPNSAAFAAASSTVAVVSGLQLYRTTNAGASYLSTGPAGYAWSYLGFTNATHGAALARHDGGSEALFYTTNAGLSYHHISIG